MRLKDYLRSDLVLPRLDATGVEGVLGELARHLADQGAVPSRKDVEDALLERERAHTTSLGHGMALPHATIKGLPAPVLMVALADPPLHFGPEGEEPVRVFFVLLSPPGREREHVKLLARVCRLVRHADFVDSLQAATSGAEVVEIIERVDEEHV